MAQLTAQVVSYDDEFKRQVARLVRACGVPVGIVEGRSAEGIGPDLVVVDIRSDASSGMAAIERLRASSASLAIFAIAAASEPDLILQAMRAGANEFFPWGAAEGSPQARTVEESFHGAVRRTATRREAANAGAKPPCVTHAFLGAKGGAGTTTVAVNCGVELARLTKRPTVIVDLKSCLGEVALFLGVRPRFTVLDAIENLHRLDKDFLKELVAKHKSGLDILAGSEQFDRPNAQDAGALEELLRVLAKTYDYVIIDAGNVINSCVAAALYTADTIFLVTNPDVPSIRNAQRLVDRVRQLGAGSERVKVLLNRVSDNTLIAPKQIETALGYGIYHTFSSDYRTVSTALNSGVPLALTNNSEIASQFDNFTRQLVGMVEETKPEPERKRVFLGMF
ncbi:MAG TPA: AAA family ATPase [Vicinamibacterales bacterium]|jgi:pilus assembly protein CpaE|nr:AAA family ATPase [Vicinamibacterales bacterium]